MKKASFSLDKYTFNRVNIEVINTPNDEISIDFKLSGIFDAEKAKESNESQFELLIDFTAFDEEKGLDNSFVKVQCIAIFSFTDVSSIDEIPTYFYKNSIAIVFPFIRAFVSSVTLQAGITPIILPTMNLSSLEGQLKEKTTTK
jgi:preprotein translocase subunit SecB